MTWDRRPWIGGTVAIALGIAAYVGGTVHAQQRWDAMGDICRWLCRTQATPTPSQPPVQPPTRAEPSPSPIQPQPEQTHPVPPVATPTNTQPIVMPAPPVTSLPPVVVAQPKRQAKGKKRKVIILRPATVPATPLIIDPPPLLPDPVVAPKPAKPKPKAIAVDPNEYLPPCALVCWYAAGKTQTELVAEAKTRNPTATMRRHALACLAGCSK